MRLSYKSDPVVVSCKEVTCANSSTMLKGGISPLAKTASWQVSVISVVLLITIEKYSRLCNTPPKLLLTSTTISSILHMTVLKDKLISENKSFFSGHITSTTFIIHSSKNSPLLNGFILSTIGLETS
uniref:Uncharacterized protein n=1 Tax=Octopus bimaculoides TaxID=37653 RepID=A0A0L8FZS4_OCTBM